MTDSPPGELVLEFPPRPEYVRAVRHTVGALAHLHGVPDEVVQDIRLAVSEACTHAVSVNADSGSHDVKVVAGVTHDRIVIDVLDRGPEPAKEISGSPDELPTEDLPFERALSLPLIRGLVDDFSIAPRDGGGRVVRMAISIQPRADSGPLGPPLVDLEEP
jgi:serine/threonine-protein kinase RsbW